MTIAAIPIVARYLGDGVQTVWPVPFPFFTPNNVRARLAVSDQQGRDLVYGQDYTVDTLEGGRLMCPVPTGQVLSVWLALPITQTMQLTQAGYLSPPDLEAAFDYRTLVEQQLAEQTQRAIKVPVGSQTTPEDLAQELFNIRTDAQAAQKGAETAKNQAQELVNGAVDRVIHEGDTQVLRVQHEGDDQIVRVQNETTLAVNSAETARLEADRATAQVDLAAAEVVRAAAEVDRATAEVGRAAAEADRATAEADRAEQLVHLAEGAQNYEASWTLAQPLASGDTLQLPDNLVYLPGKNMLRLSFEGLLCYLGHQFEEVPNDNTPDGSSRLIRLLFSAKQGHMFNVHITSLTLT